jgi:PAS domain S-box-containing protein
VSGSGSSPEIEDPDVYRSLVEGIPAILYIDRPDELSTNYYTSPQAVDLLGFTQAEWGNTQDLWIRQMHPQDRERVMAENDRSNKEGDRFFAEYRMLASDGRIVWIRDEALPVSDGQGGAIRWKGVMLDITAQKEAEEKLRWSLEVLRRTIQERRELARRLESAQEEERRRIAADIHDDPIQVMSAIDMRLQMLADMPQTATPDEIRDLQAIVRLSVERLRSLLFELRPEALDREGLVAALRQYLQHTSKETKWLYEVQDDLASEPPPELRASLYRIAQQALANARLHAEASSVSVRVRSVDGGVALRVHDDGHGFDASSIEDPQPGHLGLPTMIERAQLAGGWCRISSQAGHGTTVESWLPVDYEQALPDLSGFKTD